MAPFSSILPCSGWPFHRSGWPFHRSGWPFHHIDALDNILKEPFIQGEDFVAFILRRASTLRSLAIAGAPMNARQQVASLKLAVTPCGHFQDVLTKYLADFPLPVNQLHADLVTRLRQYAENARPVATTGSAGFASAAVTTPSDVTALQQQLQAIQIQLAAQTEQFAFLVPLRVRLNNLRRHSHPRMP
jgi:hypothetical protein